MIILANVSYVRSSYHHHYRRMLPDLSTGLVFRSHDAAQQPVLAALEIVKRYMTTRQTYYPLSEAIPLSEGIVPALWQDWVTEIDDQGRQRIRCVHYELCVLQTLRERLRCKDIYRQKLYRPTYTSDYPHLSAILTRPIRWDLIHSQYDQMIRYT